MRVKIIILLYFGLLFRLFFLFAAHSGLTGDMEVYHQFAQKISQGNLVTHCCVKNLGYPFFLGIIYFLFGDGNLIAVRIIQLIIDLITVLLVYRIALSLFGKRAAFYSFLIYLFNPFTASYIGLRLAETVSIFYITLIAYILAVGFSQKKRIDWFIIGALLGLLLFTRVQFYYFVLLFIILLSIIIITGVTQSVILRPDRRILIINKHKIPAFAGMTVRINSICVSHVISKLKRAQLIIFLLLGFLIASSYSLIGNYRDYHVISLVPPYGRGLGELYLNFYNNHRYPELLADYDKPLDEEYVKAIREFYDLPSLKDNIGYRQKYTALFWEKMKSGWPVFLGNTLRNMVWIWDKNHLSAYTDPFYPSDTFLVRMLNLILISLFLIGVIKFLIKEGKKSLNNLFVIYCLSLFIYITFCFTLASNETRHTIPFYALLSLWAGYGIKTVQVYFREKKD